MYLITDNDMCEKLLQQRIEAILDDKAPQHKAYQKSDNEKKEQLLHVNDAIAKKREDDAFLANQKRLSGDWLRVCGSLW